MPYRTVRRVCSNCGTTLGEYNEFVKEGESTATVTENESSCGHCPPLQKKDNEPDKSKENNFKKNKEEASVENFCVWTWNDPVENEWASACGEYHVFEEGDPADNHFTHCPFCGGEIKTVKLDESEDDAWE